MDPFTSVSLDPMPWGDTLANRTLRPPPAGIKTECLNNHAAWEHEPVKLVLTETGQAQAFLVALPRWGADATPAAMAAYGEVARLLEDRGLTIVHERLFGSLAVQEKVMAARAMTLRAANIFPEGPVTYIQGQPPWGEGLAGVIIRAVSCCHPQDRVWTIRDQGEPVGRGWRQGDATFLLLQNLQGPIRGPQEVNTPFLQAKRLIRRAAAILESQGASYREVVRTWFYLSDILAWYPEFNRARTAIYGNFGILPGQGNGRLKLPASTGIRGESPGGAAVALDLLAVAGPPESRPLIRQLSNPGQQDAFRYGSAFSRGALISQADTTMIQVSGTAAIDEEGRSLYPGDVRGQIDCTFDKIAALIGQEGASLQDIAAACVFVKQPEYALVYYERAAARGLETLPAVVMVADVCREELLFEIDAEVAFYPDRDMRQEAVW
jgi:enamine deaminase RidA (YjgF/YER057c/UK114 family)